MAVAIDGIASGIDTTALINAVVGAASGPKNLLETRIESYEDKTEKLSEMVSLIGDVEDALEDIEDVEDFRSFSATYAENDAFEVDVDGDAVAGTYEIEISSVASAELEVTQGFASQTTAGVLSTGSLGVTYAGTATAVTIDATTTLSDLANSIDEIDGLTAYVMDTGDATSPYRLVIQGDDAGSTNTVSLDTTGLSGGTTPSFTEQVSAASAALTVNGIAVTSDSNTVDDAVPGMTLTISDTTDSAITVTVAEDPDAIQTKVEAFITAYNAVVDYVDTNSVFDADAGIKGAFFGESSVDRALDGMLSQITKQYSDLSQDYDALSLIGIETDGEGKLELDEDTFQEILLDEPDQVADLFTGADGFIAAMLDRIDVYIDSIDGSLVVRQDTLEDRIDDLEDSVDDADRRLEKLEERLRKQFSGLESLIGASSGTSSYLSSVLASA